MSARREPGPPLNTFILRFWREPGASESRWRGQVQHVQSGERTAFADESALLRFLRRWVQTLEGDEQPQEQMEQ